MKKLIILSACLWALSYSSVRAQTNGPQTVLVTMQEYGDLHIVICRGPGNSEDVDVPGKVLRQNPHARQEAMQGVLAKLFTEGYKLQGMSGDGDHDMIHNTYLFTKTQ